MTNVPTGSSDGPLTTYELLVQNAKSGLELQRDDGSFPPGRNYSYNEQATPVRTTSLWLRLLVKVSDITGQDGFTVAANRAVDYLLSEKCRPYGYTYHCRNVEGKDYCNGLVGQANVIRALVDAAEVLGRDDALESAVDVFELHPFDDQLCLWECVEIDGKLISIDRTLNHQLIFAGDASRLFEYSSAARKQVERFLESLDKTMYLRTNGLITHYVRPPLKQVIKTTLRTPRHWKLLLNEAAVHYYNRSSDRRQKERGYHTVNMVALARIHRLFPEHAFWNSEPFSAALDFLDSYASELIAGIETKQGSDLPGIAIAKVRNEFEETSTKELRDLITEDLSDNPTAGDVPFEGLDVDDQSARALVSEFVGLPNIRLSV